METLTIILALALAAAGAYLYTLHRRLAQAESEASALRRSSDDLRREKEALAVENARLQERIERLQQEHERLDNETATRFRAIAGEILLNNSRALASQNISNLQEVLAPMKENLEQFRRNFTERYDREASERFSLRDRIGELMELNRHIGIETRRLTDALKGSPQIQGQWGEMILDNILEHAGLRRGEDYTVQESVTSDEGARLRPDVVINYTGGRKIIIDSKVSIQAYLAMLDADDSDRREAMAKAHIASVKKHVEELRSKSYQDFVGREKADFVLMFIPHEGAFIAAMNLDKSLWEKAYDSRVLIISPVHLLSVIKLVEQMWRQEKQNNNALEIARQAGLMLDKLRGFLEDMDKIDRSINGAREAWNNAFSKLTSGNGNLVGRASRLKDLGARAAKELPCRYTDAAGEIEEKESEAESGNQLP